MRRDGKVAAALVVLFMACAGPAAGSTVLNGITDNAGNAILVQAGGSTAWAVNLGNGDATNNGVTFTSHTGTSGSLGGLSYTLTGPGSYGGIANVQGIGSADPLFFQEAYYTGQTGTMTLTVSGLDPSREYLVEMMHGDGRTQNYGDGAFNLFFSGTTPDSNVSIFNFVFGTGPGGDPTAAKAKKAVSYLLDGEEGFSYGIATPPTGSDRGPSLAGFQIRDVTQDEIDPTIPEPMSLALLALSGAGLGGYMRRRRTA